MARIKNYKPVEHAGVEKKPFPVVYVVTISVLLLLVSGLLYLYLSVNSEIDSLTDDIRTKDREISQLQKYVEEQTADETIEEEEPQLIQRSYENCSIHSMGSEEGDTIPGKISFEYSDLVTFDRDTEYFGGENISCVFSFFYKGYKLTVNNFISSPENYPYFFNEPIEELITKGEKTFYRGSIPESDNDIQYFYEVPMDECDMFSPDITGILCGRRELPYREATFASVTSTSQDPIELTDETLINEVLPIFDQIILSFEFEE